MTPNPIINGIIPNSGPEKGGNNLTIKGSNFEGDISVKFGDVPGQITKITSNAEITVIVPEGKGKVNVTVSTPKGKSAAVPYTYKPSILSGIWSLLTYFRQVDI